MNHIKTLQFIKKFQRIMKKGGGGVSLGAEGSFIYIMVSGRFYFISVFNLIEGYTFKSKIFSYGL